MSRPSFPHAPHAQPPNSLSLPGPGLPELTLLVAQLQEALASLCAFHQRARRAESPGAGPDGCGADTDAGREDTPHETRCYRIPRYILDEEREMLARHKAGSWQELLGKAHDRLYATILLMGRVPAEDVLDGFSINLIAENLMMPLRMLNTLCSLTADFRPVRTPDAE